MCFPIGMTLLGAADCTRRGLLDPGRPPTDSNLSIHCTRGAWLDGAPGPEPLLSGGAVSGLGGCARRALCGLVAIPRSCAPPHERQRRLVCGPVHPRRGGHRGGQRAEDRAAP